MGNSKPPESPPCKWGRSPARGREKELVQSNLVETGRNAAAAVTSWAFAGGYGRSDSCYALEWK